MFLFWDYSSSFMQTQIIITRQKDLYEEIISPLQSVTVWQIRWQCVWNIAVWVSWLCEHISDCREIISVWEKFTQSHLDLKSKQQPSFRKLYLMSSAELNALRIYLNKVIEVGIIHKLISSAASLIIFVLKSDSSLWLVIDYRHLNNITIQN